jgi:hypothetical protein
MVGDWTMLPASQATTAENSRLNALIDGEREFPEPFEDDDWKLPWRRLAG